ncbi:hypothetical protein BH11PLA1_BH11PLA1_07030 [soil metagenome]
MLDALFTSQAVWFSVPALVATGIFGVRMLMLLALGHGDHAIDGFDAGHGGHGADGAAGHAAEFLSVQAILAFLMGFGWGGLAMLQGPRVGMVISAATGIGFGCALLVLFVMLMRGLRRLNVSGNVPLAALAGATGEVVVSVPASGLGMGEVRIVVAERARFCNAVSDGAPVPMRTRVRVHRVNPDNTVTVCADDWT